MFHNSTKEGKRETPYQNLIEKFSVPPSCRKSPLSSNEGLFVERGGKGGLFVEKGEKLAFGALFLPSPVAANSPLRGENDHFSLCALERLVVIKFPRVNPKLFHLYVFTYKIDLFSYCRIFKNSFPFASSRISTMFYSRSLTTFVYSPSRNSSSFS